MKATDFLIEKLNAIYKAHSYLEIQYEFRSHINTHIIEVRPLHCFEGDKNYIQQQIILEDLFEELYPSQEIVFITDNPLVKVQIPILSLGISEMNVNIGCLSQSDLFAKVDIADYDDLVLDYLPEKVTYEEYDIPASPMVVENSENVYFVTKKSPIISTGILSKIPDQIKKLTKNIKKDSENSNSESFFFNIAL